MIYYNQNNYSKVPYPSPSLPNATVKSGGCGVVCAAMIVENMTGKSFPPPTATKYAIANDARVAGGTDMVRLSKCISRDYGLTYTTTSDEDKLIAHLKNGDMAIANVGGDSAGYIGVFSNAGHYIVVAGLQGDKLVILDPGLYGGKFNKTGRKGKVEVNGNEIYCAPAVLHLETRNRSPNYYLFGKEKPMVEKSKPSVWAEDAAVWAVENGIIKGDENGDCKWQDALTREQFCVMLKRYCEKY